MANSTKEALGSALKKMMAVKAIDKITIKDLVEICGVNRQTFYYHFDDVYDLLEWVFPLADFNKALGMRYAGGKTYKHGSIKFFAKVKGKLCKVKTIGRIGGFKHGDFGRTSIVA